MKNELNAMTTQSHAGTVRSEPNAVFVKPSWLVSVDGATRIGDRIPTQSVAAAKHTSAAVPRSSGK